MVINNLSEYPTIEEVLNFTASRINKIKSKVALRHKKWIAEHPERVKQYRHNYLVKLKGEKL